MPDEQQEPKLCECGCGEPTRVYPRTGARRFRAGHGSRVEHPSQKHGMSCTPTWYSWSNMVSRCTKTYNPAYPRYGGRGITICERWLGKDGFTNFLADMGERSEGFTLERVDNEKGYGPDNCRWATYKEQALNTRNVTLTDEDVAWVRANTHLPRKELAARLSVTVPTIYNIIKRKHRFADTD